MNGVRSKPLPIFYDDFFLRALLVASRGTRASAKVDFENNLRLHPFPPNHAGTDTVIDVRAHTHTDALKGC